MCCVLLWKFFLFFSNTPLSPLESKLISREVADGWTKGYRSRRVVCFVCLFWIEYIGYYRKNKDISVSFFFCIVQYLPVSPTILCVSFIQDWLDCWAILVNILLLPNSFCIFCHSFMSGCIVKINPDKGSKVECQEKKKSNAVNPKVLTLINRIAEFEWSTYG